MNAKQFTYAGPLKRIAANMFDTVLLILPGAALASLLITPGSPDHDPVLNTGAYLVIFMFNAAYYTLCTSSVWQATLGQRAWGIYVIRRNGQPLTQRDALERYLAYVMPTLPLYASFLSQETALMLSLWLNLMWFMPIFYTAEQVGIHDRLCKTRVVTGHKK